MTIFKTNSEFVAHVKNLFGEKYDYSLTKYTKGWDKIGIICIKHNLMFNQCAFSHLKGHVGCPLCKSERASILINTVGMNSKSGKQKSKNTKLEKYGKESFTNREKAKQTCLILYGDENYNNPQKAHNTVIEKYGSHKIKGEHSNLQRETGYTNPSQLPEVKLKKENTFLEKTNYKSNFHNPKFQKEMSFRSSTKESRNKSKQTCLKKYGVEHYSQCAEAIEKNYQQKALILPSGKEIKCMGYEPKAISILLKLQYKEDDLLLKNRPSIKYFWSVELGGDDMFHYYHPDIVIISEHKIIEVKSEYTFRKDLRLQAKILGCESQGWKIEVWIL